MSGYTSVTDAERAEMLATIGASSIDELFDVPAGVRLDRDLELPDGLSEAGVYARMRTLAARNADAESEVCFLGAGMYDHYAPAIVDAIVSRSEFLTPYTPYQPEISQGGLQAMFEFGPLWLITLEASAVFYGPFWALLVATLGVGGLLAGRLRLDRPIPVAIVVLVMLASCLTLTSSRDLGALTVAMVALTFLLVVVGIHVSRLLHDAVPSTIRTGVVSGVGAVSWLVWEAGAATSACAARRSSGGDCPTSTFARFTRTSSSASCSAVRLASTVARAETRFQ